MVGAFVDGLVEGFVEGFVEGLAVGVVEGFTEGFVLGVVEGLVLGVVEGLVLGLVVGVGVIVVGAVPGIRTPKVGTPGPIELTARTRTKRAVLFRLTVKVLVVTGKVATLVHFKPSGEVSTTYFKICLVLLPIAGIQLNFAVVLVITSACITGAGAAGCGTPEATAEAGPVPIWLTAKTLKK